MALLHRARVGVASTLAALAFAAPAIAQPIAEPALRAAFLYNFAKFTTWPAEALRPGAPLAICVVGDGAIAGMLTQIIAGRPIDGRDVRVTTPARDAGLRACHLVYIAGDDPHAEAEALEYVKNTSTLTVAGGKSDVRAGAIVRLFVDGGRMRFSVNVDAMQRARVRISSKVLTLGVILKDDGDGTR